jgi:hypothetical protein
LMKIFAKRHAAVNKFKKKNYLLFSAEKDAANAFSKHLVLTPLFENNDPTLFSSLKKELSSVQTSNPPNRIEALILKDWMENNIEKIKKNYSEKKKKLENIWEVFSLTFSEIIRQNYFECNERGILLQRVFKLLEEFRKEEQEQIKEEKKKLKIDALDSYNRIHNMYKKEIDDRKREKQIAEEMKREEERKRIQIQTENQELEKVRQTMQNQIEEMGKTNDIVKKRLRQIQNLNFLNRF